MNKVQEIIHNLLTLPKHQDNIEKYFTEYHNLGLIGIIETHLHPGKNIYRCRLNETNESFSSLSQISYPPKPQIFFGRASCPNVGVFYGSYTPFEIIKDEIGAAYVINAYEISSFLRDIHTTGEERITIGKWQVKKDIRLATIAFHEEFQNKTKLAIFLKKDFMDYLKYHKEYKEETILWNNFISNEFAKPVEDANSQDYIISATYTDFLIRKGFDGVVYPTVRLDGRGFYLALTPAAVNSCLKLELVAEGKFYKKEMKTVMDWERICEIRNSNLIEFKDDSNKLGESFCRRMVEEQ